MISATLPPPTRAADHNGYAIPDYKVVERIENIEIRDYAPYLEANVKRAGRRAGAIGSGFRTLARYIFGGNQDGQKLSMTAPVTQERLDDIWSVAFVLPKDVSAQTAPLPNAQEITIKTRPAARMAVIRFSGFWTEARLRTHETALLNTLSTAGLTPTGSPLYMFYDDPRTLPWNRRNEIGIRIE